MADLNGDGRRDVVSGSWPGELYVFYGNDAGLFDPPKKLMHPDSSAIQEGKASAVAVADWDSDGDQDLIVGNFHGSVVLVLNEGNRKEPRWGVSRKLSANGQAIRVDGDGGPCVADWDGDGVRDLLVGSGDGAVHWFRNLAKQGEPELAASVLLFEPDDFDADRVGDPVRPGARAKLCVADWNGDGLQDLLVGDAYWRTLEAPVPTSEEQKELDKANAQYGKLSDREFDLREDMDRTIRAEKGWAEDRELTDVEDDWLFDETFRRLYEVDEFRKLQEEMEEPLEVMRRFQPKTETHGYVWVCLRKVEPVAGSQD